MAQKSLIKIVEEKVEAKRKEILAKVKAENPVDTGLSRDSWVLTKKGLYNPVDYVIPLNNNTHFIDKALLGVKGIKFR